MMEETRGTRNKIFWIILCATIVVGVGLRMYGLTDQSLWYDEVYSITHAERSYGQIVADCKADVHPPLHYFALHVWIKVFGPGELSVRSFAALFGILLIPVICYVGSSLFNRRVGLISAFIAAISQFHIRYSQEVRMYSMLTLLGLISLFLLHKAVSTNTRSSWTAYVICIILTIYTHNYGLFIAASGLVFFIIYALTQKLKWKRFLIAEACIAISYIPWLPTIMDQFQNRIFGFIPQMQVYHIYDTLKFYGGFVFGHFDPGLNDLITYPGLSLFFCCFIAGIFSLRRYGRFSIPYVENNSGLFLLLCYLCVTLSLPMIISVKKPIFLPGRYSIVAWPAFALILGLGISKIKRMYRLLPVIVILMFVASCSLYWHYFVYVKSWDRVVAGFIQGRVRENDLIVFAPDFPSLSVDYYLRTPLKQLGFPYPTLMEVSQSTHVEGGPRTPATMVRLTEEKLANSDGKVFLVLREMSWINGVGVVRKLFDERFKKTESVRYTDPKGHTDVTVYSLPENYRTETSVTIGQ